MGSIMGKSLKENFEKNKNFMIELQSVQLERQIHMQDQMRMRMQAMQLARAREMFYWWASFYVLAVAGSLVAFQRTRRPPVLAPILPLSFIVGYQADLAYGNKLERIKAEADFIMQFENGLLEPAAGVPNAAMIDAARLQYEGRKRYKVHDHMYS